MSDVKKRITEEEIAELRQAKESLDYAASIIRCERESGVCVMIHNHDREPCNSENCSRMKSDLPPYLKSRLEGIK